MMPHSALVVRLVVFALVVKGLRKLGSVRLYFGCGGDGIWLFIEA